MYHLSRKHWYNMYLLYKNICGTETSNETQFQEQTKIDFSCKWPTHLRYVLNGAKTKVQPEKVVFCIEKNSIYNINITIGQLHIILVALWPTTTLLNLHMRGSLEINYELFLIVTSIFVLKLRLSIPLPN